MTSEYLLEAVGLLDDELIREAEEYVPQKKRTHYGAWLSLAACLAVVIALGYGLTHIGMGGGSAAPNEASGNAAGAPAASPGSMPPALGGAAPSNEGQSGDPSGDMPNGDDPDAPENSQGDYCAAIMVDGVVYWSTGIPVPGEVAEEAVRTVTGYTDAVPEEDGQTNFDRELTTRYAMTDRGLAVLIGQEWILFDPVPPWEE